MKPNHPTVALKPGRERSLLRRHPWVFSGAIGNLSKEPKPGETVCVRTAEGAFLGWGAYSPDSQIRVRMWSFNESDEITEDWITRQVQNAVARRISMHIPVHDNSFRLIHSESDFLPGVIADQFGSTVVVQILTAGAEYWRNTIYSALQKSSKCTCLIEKSDTEARKQEGLISREEVIIGDESGSKVIVVENGIKYRVQILGGQKTGFYLDQRVNRLLVQEYSKGKRVLDCFSFQGGFALNALKAGAVSVVAVDSSETALKAIRTNVEENQLDSGAITLVEANAFEYLRLLRDQKEQFDLIILDPPKLAATQSKVERALRAYKDLNLSACKLLAPGGILFTFSCSGGVTPELFQSVVAGAALDAGRNLQFIQTMRQGPDHPVLSTFPESEYLKGLVCLAVN